LARQGWSFAKGVRWIVQHPCTEVEARTTVAHEAAHRGERFLRSLDELVWPFPASPTRLLLDNAGLEPHDVRGLVGALGLDDGLGKLRDLGVYVS
jgi:hypothetical protein